MTPHSAASIRLLASWLQQRRALSDRVESLLLHGPTAVDRVADRAAELRKGYAAELAAFDAFVAHVASDAGAAGTGAEGAAMPPAEPASYPPLRSVAEPT